MAVMFGIIGLLLVELLNSSDDEANGSTVIDMDDIMRTKADYLLITSVFILMTAINV